MSGADPFRPLEQLRERIAALPIADAHVLNAQRIALSMLANLETYDRPVVAVGYVRDRLNALVAELRQVTK